MKEYVIYSIILLFYILINIFLWIIYSNSGCFKNVCNTPYYLENTNDPVCFKSSGESTVNIVLFSFAIILSIVSFLMLIYLNFNYDIHRKSFVFNLFGIILLLVILIILYVECVSKKFSCLSSVKNLNIRDKKYINYNCEISSGERNNSLYVILLVLSILIFLVNVGVFIYGINKLDEDD